MIRVKIKNFQSLADAEMIIDGFTALTGPNNCGKSALVRAIKGLFKNNPASVRTGETYSEVTLLFDDGNEVTWRKGKGHNTYVINGKTLENVGRSVPDEVQALGIHRIEVGRHRMWPQIASQNVGQVFLLDYSGAVVAEAVADVERVGMLNKALALAEREQRRVKSKIKVRDDDLLDLQQDLESFAGLDTLAHRVGRIQGAEEKAARVRVKHDMLCDTLQGLQEAQGVVSALSGVGEVHLPPAEVVTRARKMADLLDTLTEIQDRAGDEQGVLDNLQGVEAVSIPSLEGVGELSSLIEGLEELHSGVREQQGILDRLPDVEVPQSLERAYTLVDILQGLQEVESEIRQEEKILRDLQGYSPEGLDGSGIKRVRACAAAIELFEDLDSQVRDARSDLSACITALAECERETQQAQREFEDTLELLGVCPLCGSASHEE